jgi:hypothetical protein
LGRQGGASHIPIAYQRNHFYHFLSVPARVRIFFVQIRTDVTKATVWMDSEPVQAAQNNKID